jgi:AraC-like DNA-binding protein
LDTSRPFSVIAASFSVGGGFPFFGMPAGELQNSSVPLELLPGFDAARLSERLLEAQTGLDRFRVLEAFLLGRLKEHTGRSPAIRYAVNAFDRPSPLPKVGAVAEQLGWTSKRLVARFRAEVGLPPKVYSRVARFRKAVAALEDCSDVDWTDVALSCGYFDQAHFSHDFREFSGVTPSSYLRDRASTNHVPVR